MGSYSQPIKEKATATSAPKTSKEKPGHTIGFDGDPRLEFMELMMYGFWGESHTNELPEPFRGI
jgi:hypothetical protein